MSNDHKNVEATAGGGEFMLFGVRVVVDSMRKSVSLNNLSQYQHHLDSSPDNDVIAGKIVGNIAGGYASADEGVHRSSTTTVTVTVTATAINRERKRGVPWTEEEHKLFLQGLQKVGKGDWRGISRTFVKTRTPTQVASHAQKYFLRRSNLDRRSRRRRSSLFDITTSDSVDASSNDQISNENKIARVENQSQQSKFETSNVKFTISPSPVYNQLPATRAVQSPGSSSNESMVNFNLNTNTNTNSDTNTSTLSLNLSLSMFPQCLGKRDGVITVA